MTTSLSQSLSRFPSAPYSVAAQLPASLSRSRSPVDGRLANLALVTVLGESHSPHIKLCAASSLRQIAIDADTLKALGDLLHTCPDPYSRWAALHAMHSMTTTPETPFLQTSLALQHELLDLFSSSDERIGQEAILAFARLHRYRLDSSAAVLQKVSDLLGAVDLRLQTRLLLLSLLKQIGPDSDAIALCMRQIDAALADRAMDVGTKSRILSAATGAILRRPASDDLLEELLGRHLHDFVLAARCPLTAAQFATLFADAMVADDPERSRLALRALLRCSGPLPDIVRQRLLALLGADRQTPLCLAVLARFATDPERRAVLQELVDRAGAPLNRAVLVHVHAVVRRDPTAAAPFVERIVARLRRSAPSPDAFICLAYCLARVEDLAASVAASLADLCQGARGVPARLLARVCLLAAGRGAQTAARFLSVVDALLTQSETSFQRYRLCIECLVHGRAGGAALAVPALSGLMPLAPAWASWIAAVRHLAECQRTEWYQGAGIASLYAARQSVASISVPGREAAFQLDYLQLRLEFLEAFAGGGCSRPVTGSQRPLLDRFAARFHRLTCCSVALPPGTRAYLRRLADLCRTAVRLDALLQLLTSTTPAGFFTLYQADLVFARATIADSGLLSVTVRLRPSLQDHIREVAALIGDDEACIPLEFRAGSYSGETALVESSCRLVIVGTEASGQQWQLGTILFCRS